MLFSAALARGAGGDYLYVSTESWPTPSIYQISSTGNVSIFTTVPSPSRQAWVASDRSGYLYVNATGELFTFGGGKNSNSPIDGFNQLIAADPNDDVFLANINNGVLAETARNGKVTLAVNVRATGVAADAFGNLYVAGTPYVWGSDYELHALALGLYKVDLAGSFTAYSTAISYPQQLAVDSAGDLFTFNGLNNASLLEVTPDGNLTTLATNLQNPAAIAIGSDGTVYVGAGSNIYTVANGATNLFATLPNVGITSIAWSPIPVTVPEPGLLDLLGLALTVGLLRQSRRGISFDIKLLRG